jgi:hypothetical protein
MRRLTLLIILVASAGSERDIAEWILFMGGAVGVAGRPGLHKHRIRPTAPRCYHSLQIYAQKQLQHGILFTAAYTFYKAIDDTRLRRDRMEDRYVF